MYPASSLPQVVHQLQNNIEKMLTKVHAGQKVTALYLAVRDVLRKVSSSSPCHHPTRFPCKGRELKGLNWCQGAALVGHLPESARSSCSSPSPHSAGNPWVSVELADLPLHLDLLCGMAELYHGELEDMELMALDALKAADLTKEDMAKMETQFLAEREFRYRSLASQKVHIDRHWLKEASERHLRVQARYELAMDFPNLLPQDPLVGTKLEATKSQMEREALVTEKIEKARAAVQCSRLWVMDGAAFLHDVSLQQSMVQKPPRVLMLSPGQDIPSRLLAQQKSSVDLEQYVKECKEKKQALKETLKELELKQAELKFRQPPNTISSCCGSRRTLAPCLAWEVVPAAWSWAAGSISALQPEQLLQQIWGVSAPLCSCMDVNVVGSRMLEEELRMNLQWEEARLEQMRAQMLRNQELLLEFENGIDNLFVHLHGITVPGQDDSFKARGVEEKLQHCEQKLQYLVQRVANLPSHSHSPDEDNEVLGGSIPDVVFGTHMGLSWMVQQKLSSQLGGWRWPQGRAMEQLSPRWHWALQGVPSRGTLRWGTPWVVTRTSPSAINPECLSQTFVKVRNLLEKTITNDPQNLKISFEDIGSRVQGRRAQHGHVPQQLS
ncbi:coiled-coil domain-containing protein 183 [Morphnus guianensis]